MTAEEREKLLLLTEERLRGLGYEVQTGDAFALGFLIDKVEADILASCNVDTIPAGLRNAAVDRVCGEFLTEKKAAGPLSGDAEERIASTVKLGDTQVTFVAEATPAQRFDALTAALCGAGGADLAAYRRLAW